MRCLNRIDSISNLFLCAWDRFVAFIFVVVIIIVGVVVIIVVVVIIIVFVDSNFVFV
jgi:hypothetical protein